jgi:hypothetical protein
MNLFLTFGLLGSIALYGADVSGKWTGMVPSRGEARETAFLLKQDGGKLTGSLKVADQEMKIEDGKVDGNSVSFTVTQTGGNGSAKVMFKGTVSGSEIKFTRQREGGDPREFTAKRAGS